MQTCNTKIEAVKTMSQNMSPGPFIYLFPLSTLNCIAVIVV